MALFRPKSLHIQEERLIFASRYSRTEMADTSIYEQEISQQSQLTRLRWFVCTANTQRMTHSLREMLDKLSIEYYMALGTKLVKRGQTMIQVEESLLGSFFFVRSSFKEALKLKSDFGLDYQYVRDGQKQLLWVPDEQMQDFRTVIERMSEKVDFNADIYAVGDPVIVTRGPLCGVHGTLTGIDDKHLQLLLKVPGVLAISVRIAKSNIRKVLQ